MWNEAIILHRIQNTVKQVNYNIISMVTLLCNMEKKGK